MAKGIEGVVVSTKMNKTVAVRTERKYRHPVYQKVVTRHKKYLVHNEGMNLAVGDKVRILAVRPISKNKHFQVVTKLDK